MNKNLILILIAVLLICIGLSGCTDILNNNQSNNQSSEESRFVGTWKYTQKNYWGEYINYTTTFFSDGTLSSTILIGSIYEIKDEKLVLTWYLEGNPYQTVYDYSFSDNDNILTLTLTGSGQSYVFIKQ